MIVWIKNIPPVQFSANFFEMENGDVAITLEKFLRARERGYQNDSLCLRTDWEWEKYIL